MAGLVGYDSSDDDSGDEQPQVHAPALPKQTQAPSQPSRLAVTTASKPPAPVPKPPQPQDTPSASLPLPPPGAAPLGPSLPPMATSSSSLPEPSPSTTTAGPSSPYTTTRSLIHDLTLPSIPDFAIPASPPGSPSPSTAATGKKFAQFLALKKSGTHFNAKLEQSPALRNPALTDKLLQFVDVGPPMQYETTLAREVWDPGAFPAWAFRDGLRRGRDAVAKEREAARAAPGRTSVEFVSATTTGGGGKGEKRKGGWQ